MKKYLFIFKTEIINSLQYMFNLLSGFIAYIIMIYVFLCLWKYMYSDPASLINGYNLNQMIWYIIITEILWMSLGGKKICRKITNDVKNGNIAYNINKPYNYILYNLSSNLGSIFIKFIVFTVLAMILGFIFLGTFPKLNILSILAVLLTSILATTISILIMIGIGLFSFIIEDSTPLYWVYSKFILVLGTIFPIEFFSGILRTILKYSPIYVVSYGPAKLFVNFSTSEFIAIIISQLIYLVISYLIATFIYKKGVKKLNVNGG